MSSIHNEAHLVDLTEAQLKEFLGHTYHSIRNVEEEKKNDPDIQQMRDKLTAYIKDNYDEELKTMKARLKAARALAKAKGIKWNPPEVQ